MVSLYNEMNSRCKASRKQRAYRFVWQKYVPFMPAVETPVQTSDVLLVGAAGFPLTCRIEQEIYPGDSNREKKIYF
jgi:hypothetical protein